MGHTPHTAVGRGDEFNPESEKHFPLLILKAVEPGCTLELQIEDVVSGKVTRATTMDSAEEDREVFESLVLEAFREAWSKYTHNR